MLRILSINLTQIRNSLIGTDSKFHRVFRHRDFRLLWIGAFCSFIGSWIQNVGQGYLVYELTGSKEKLALVSFCTSIPVTFLGPIAGSFVDTMNKKKLLVWTQVFFAASAIFIAVLATFKLLKLEYLLVVALLNGIVSCLEMPVRQSIISSTVPIEDLPVAIPFQGLTFNLARVVGPAIGGLLLAKIGVESCYWVNGLSFFALIFAGLAIRADLTAKQRSDEGMVDLIIEGFRYTWREPRLRMLLILEISISLFSLFYLAQIPAIAKDILHVNKDGLGHVYTAIGIGAILALVVTTKTSDRHVKGKLIRSAVSVMGFSLVLLAFTHSLLVATPILILLGMSGVTIFNTCNSLFQMIAPERLRGRVVSMHIWALNGVGPIGTLAFGYVAESHGLAFAMQLAGMITVLLSVWAWTNPLRLESQ